MFDLPKMLGISCLYIWVETGTDILKPLETRLTVFDLDGMAENGF